MSVRPSARVSRYTYSLHLRAAVFEGILGGTLVLNDVVARKALGATQAQLVLLTMAPAALQLFSLLLAQRFDGMARPRLFLAAGLLGRGVLFAAAAVQGPWLFLAILLVHGLVQTVLVPAQNAIWQANYDPATRGRLFSQASTWGGVATAAAALGAGVLLDRSPHSYRWVYPAAGVAGLVACVLFGRIRVRRLGLAAGESFPQPAGEAAGVLPTTPWSVLQGTLGRDAGFRRYETAMFVYGMGFMCMQPVFARLFVDELKTDYATASLAKGVVFYGVYVAALTSAGRLHDKVGLARLGALSALFLAAFAGAATLVATPAQAVAAFGLYGLGMAGINVVWSMGPLRYAPPAMATRYMGVHVMLVGVRALLGHPLGGYLAEAAGSSRAAFGVSFVFFAAASFLMIRAARADERESSALDAGGRDG